MSTDKLAKAKAALDEGNFLQADKLFSEIEDSEELSMEIFAQIAFSRGKIAQQELRWQDATEHHARAAKLYPCWRTLIYAQGLAFNAGDYNASIYFGMQAKKAAIAEHGEESEQHVTSLNNLAESYQEQKQYKDAEKFYKKALKINKKVFGENNQYTAAILNNIGIFYRMQEKYRSAESFLKKALKIRTKIFNKNHPSIATSLDSLATLYFVQKFYKKAEPLYIKALKIAQETGGDDDFNTAISLRNLAGLYYPQKRYKEAEPLFKRSLEILEKTLGPEHPTTKSVKDNYETFKTFQPNAEMVHP